VLEGLELVELEDPAQSAALACERQALKMEVTAVTPEELESMSDRLAGAAQDPSGLAVRDLGDEGADQIMIDMGLLEAVVDAKGLSREGAMAFQAQEALDETAVARTEVAAFEAPAAMTAGERGTVVAGAPRGLEAHGGPFSPGEAGGLFLQGDSAD
jgi:hypothetical protein